jgi:hypothetical protein
MRGGFNLRSHDGDGQSFLSTKTRRATPFFSWPLRNAMPEKPPISNLVTV